MKGGFIMKKRCFMVMVMCFILLFGAITAYAASATGSYEFSNAEVKVNQGVSFVYGPLTIQDKYWGNASISGKDSDAASVKVKGWTSKRADIISKTLNYKDKSVSVSKVSCGYGQSWGKISVTFENKTHTITANDPN